MDLSFLPKYWAYFNYGVLVTIMISVSVVFFGTLIGVLVTLIKRSHVKPLTWVVNLYVWIFRGTPMVVQIMIAFAWMHFNNMPTIGFGVLDLDFSRLLPGIIIISLNSGAYISEIVRAGIEAVPKGQLEAAYSLGIRPQNAMRYVILPQAFKNILPALGNEFITIIKDSALLQTIGVMELWNGAQSVVTATYSPISPLLVAAFYYLMVTTVMAQLLAVLERHMAQGGNH
ncbi:TPA: amino acid ABC transporter permease [Streptococcus pyogenes]|uniref:Amino acid ABC transporter (Permease protein) n=4 Tax=Streptococcus pyogenes TaxID=1314 RepID=Q99YW8_STRP1|nr:MULTISPECIES: amino acid ABC transporter permease [Streptococcus]ABF36308.1 Arginine transport system permease protein artQ [Streptococcus pyogenes MGAS2096]AIG50587.1 glutamine ABC transporter permease [Streptococcus pyogenes STAB901]EPZ40642.1 ABC transporter, permease protein [Streptococcus pyogenes GA41345]EPZ46581.1 ABC transporter, permease protein [Streptococcus pyogenes GA40634]ERL17137.1 ABC transporter, permease protein [Streptococcus pyogenes GA41046]ESA51346.1 ABC transporter, 